MTIVYRSIEINCLHCYIRNFVNINMINTNLEMELINKIKQSFTIVTISYNGHRSKIFQFY